MKALQGRSIKTARSDEGKTRNKTQKKKENAEICKTRLKEVFYYLTLNNFHLWSLS